MAKFYDVRARYETEDEKGKVIKTRERYILQAESPTDAEVIAIERYADGVNEYRVVSVSETNIYDVHKKEEKE